MAFSLQVAIDARDPHTLAAWWAETLGWEVEPSDEAFIRKMIAEGYATEDDTRVFNGKLVWRTATAVNPPAGVAAPRLYFQEVPEEKVVKNRTHLDIRHGDADVDEVRLSLIQRGATFLYEGRQGPHVWHTFQDPEGNEFCV